MNGINLVVGVVILVALVVGVVLLLGRTQRRSGPASFQPNAAVADADRRRLQTDLRSAAPRQTELPTELPTDLPTDLPTEVPVEAERTIRVREWLTT